jgi:hypothetical protein
VRVFQGELDAVTSRRRASGRVQRRWRAEAMTKARSVGESDSGGEVEYEVT